MSSNIQALVNLNGHMNDLKWGQLRLFFHILEAGSSAEINKANDLLTFKNLLVPKFCNQALPVIHFMLSKIEVIGLDQLIVDQCTEQNRLEYPALLIYICKSLDTSKFNKLRVIASQPEYLKGNHDNIHSCEELMLRLHCHTLISPTNLKFIIDWLPRIGLQNIAGEVSKFRSVQAPAGVEPSGMHFCLVLAYIIGTCNNSYVYLSSTLKYAIMQL